MRSVWLLVLVGCGGSDPDCRIEAVTDDMIGGAQVMDCGHLGLPAMDAATMAAHDCVLAADAAHQPYVAQWEIQGIDSRVARAYLGLQTADGWQTADVSYDGDPGGGGGEHHPRTSWSTCSGLVDMPACSDLQYSLCLMCAARTDGGICDSTP